MTLKKDCLTPIWPNSNDPRFVLKYFEGGGQTDIFRLNEANTSSTLRIDSGVSEAFVKLFLLVSYQAGISVRLTQYHGKQNIMEVDETTPATVPFTFENCCSELVIKVKQYGEKQVGLSGYPFGSLNCSIVSAGL